MYQAINNPVNYGGLELKTASSSHLPHSVCLTKNILKKFEKSPPVAVP